MEHQDIYSTFPIEERTWRWWIHMRKNFSCSQPLMQNAFSIKIEIWKMQNKLLLLSRLTWSCCSTSKIWWSRWKEFSSLSSWLPLGKHEKNSKINFPVCFRFVGAAVAEQWSKLILGKYLNLFVVCFNNEHWHSMVVLCRSQSSKWSVFHIPLVFPCFPISSKRMLNV